MASEATAQFRRNIAPRYETGEDGRPVIPPPVTSDVHTILAQPYEFEMDSGTLEQHDKIVDQRFPLLTWIRTIERNTDNSSYSSLPAASPASLIGYMLTLSTAFFYYSDFCHGLAPSAYAHAINNDSRYSTFFEALLDCNVPGILSPELQQWQTTFDPVSNTYRQVTSLAASTFQHDFGRQFPASIFFLLHNLQATLPPNAGSNALRAHFWTETVATVTFPGNAAFPLTPAHYFGYMMRTPTGTATPAHVFPNWLNTAVDTILTTNHIRTTFGTVTIRRLPLNPTALADLRTYNPYLYLVGYTHENDLTLRLVMQNLSGWIKTTFPSSQPLRNYIQRGSGPQIQYLSFRTSEPTWHTQSIPDRKSLIPTGQPNFFEENYSASVKTRTDFANAIRFLPGQPTPPTARDTLSTIVEKGDTPTVHKPNSVLVQLVSDEQRPAPENPASYRTFDLHSMDLPMCRIIVGNLDSPTSSFSKILTSGILIETNDISMIGLPTPNPRRPLHLENTRFTLGSILLSLTRNAFTDVDHPIYCRRTEENQHRTHTQLFIRGPSHRNLIPRFYPGYIGIGTTMTNETSGVGDLSPFLPGAWIIDNARRALDVTNVFAREQDNAEPFLPEGEIYIWSSFRYRPKTDLTKIFILPTLEHITGIQPKQYTSRHLATRLF